MKFSENGNLGFIDLTEMADALNKRSRYIQLPSFQRDAVWDENHIELLWDSLYRGYPIGSLLFADVSQLSSNNHLAVRDSQVSRQQAAHNLHDDIGETKYIIIDGQQRVIAVALGFRLFHTDDAARMWIDLGANSETLFAVCSVQRPWGRGVRSRQIDWAKKHLDARLLSPRGDLLYEYSPLKFTWPLRCKLPVPLADLLVWLEKDRPGDWRELVPEMMRNEEANAELEAIFKRLQETRQLTLPVYLVRKMSTTQLGEIFQRLNKQGVSMTDQDLFFSALKMKWPQAHNLVWSIYADRETGYFMSASEIVRLAVRLVFGTERHIARLNLDGFERLTQEDLDRFAALKNLLQKNEGEPYGRLHSLLRRGRKLLSYDPARDEKDPGLPSVLLAQLHPRVWHTLVAWLANNETATNHDREEIIRYALMDYFFSGNASQRLERIPFELAWRAKQGFPGFEIYAQLWRAGNLETSLPPAASVAEQLDAARETIPPAELFRKEKQLGLWVQRASLQEWFPNFDPLLYGSATEYPFDLDHILPSAYKNMRGRRGTPAEEFWQWRRRVINGPGNVRYWPASLNRSDQHKNLVYKHLLGPSEQLTPQDSLLRAYGLETVGQVRAASLLDEAYIEAWEQGGNDPHPYDWRDPQRIRALRKATDARRLTMYKRFYEGLGFRKWHARFPDWLANTIRVEVTNQWIKETRAGESREMTLSARTIAEGLRLPDQISAICAALDAPEFHTRADLTLKKRNGPEIGEDATWTIKWRADAESQSRSG